MTSALVTLALVVVCGHLANAELPYDGLARASFDLGASLHQKLRNQPNLIYSPLGLHSTLAFTAMGARRETEIELLTLLNWPTPRTDNSMGIHDKYRDLLTELTSVSEVEVDTARVISVCQNRTILPSFQQDAQDKYQALVTSRDPTDPQGAEREINEFVSNKTQGLIQEVIPKNSIDYKSSLLLVGALVVNGTWDDAFDPTRTQKQNFVKADGSMTQVDMMNDTRIVFHKKDNETGVDLVQIPLQGGRFALLVALPQTTDGIKILEDQLTNSEMIKNIFVDLREKKIDLALPRFKVESKLELKDALKELGMVKATDMNRADFSGITEQDKQYISKVYHNSVLEVNEFGAAGASASGVQVDSGIRESSSGSSPSEAQIVADHPFMFFLRDTQSGIVLLQGKFSGN